MTLEARRAIGLIRACIETDRYALAIHFSHRMEQRGLFWPDVLAVIEQPNDVRSDGMDIYNRPKWVILGEAADGGEIAIVCAVDSEMTDTEFITIHWE